MKNVTTHGLSVCAVCVWGLGPRGQGADLLALRILQGLDQDSRCLEMVRGVGLAAAVAAAAMAATVATAGAGAALGRVRGWLLLIDGAAWWSASSPSSRWRLRRPSPAHSWGSGAGAVVFWPGYETAARDDEDAAWRSRASGGYRYVKRTEHRQSFRAVRYHSTKLPLFNKASVPSPFRIEQPDHLYGTTAAPLGMVFALEGLFTDGHGLQRTPPSKKATYGGLTPKSSKKQRACSSGSQPQKTPSSRKRKLVDENVQYLVGLVSETAAQHRARHVEMHPQCPRCKWLAWGDQWKRKQGSNVLFSGREEERIEWVAERPIGLGGHWALGCAVCSFAAKRLRSSCRGGSRISCTWAKFESCPESLQAQALAQHGACEGHRLSLDLYLSPEKPLREIVGNMTDRDLLKGSVPRPTDWLRMWRYTVEGSSFRSSARITSTEAFLGASTSGSRQDMKALMQTMVGQIRSQKHVRLKLASFISIMVDDRGAYKVVRYRCDCADGSKLYDEGILTVIHKGGCGMQVEEWDDDFCEREAAAIIDGIKQFCTLDAAFDKDLFSHFESHTLIFASDGCQAALKTGRVLKDKHLLPALVCILRDPAHAVRIAAKDPLKADERFGSFWKQMFDSPHALIRDVEFSDQMRAKLESAQERVRDVLGSQGGGLTAILKHLRAAKPRFESYATPARRYCLMLNSLALLLAMTASDKRKERPVREKAEELLTSMTPESVVIAGLTADYAAESLDFTRAFDRSDIDPASVAFTRNAFVDRMQALFLQGLAALEPPDDPLADRTMLQIAMEQVAACNVFHFNDKKHCLWSAGASAKVKDSMAHMAAIVEANIDRVLAELPDTDISIAMQTFNLQEWSKPDISVVRVDSLRRHFRNLCKCLDLDPSVGEREFKDALPPAISAYRDALLNLPHGGVVDHRVVWGGLLGATMFANLQVLPAVIRFYMAVPVGTCEVERSLGTMAAALNDHTGPLGVHVLWELVELKLDGPTREEDLFVKGGGDDGPFKFTDFSRACQKAWIFRHGRRFRALQKNGPESHRSALEQRSILCAADEEQPQL